jgi:hypothetical protein
MSCFDHFPEKAMKLRPLLFVALAFAALFVTFSARGDEPAGPPPPSKPPAGPAPGKAADAMRDAMTRMRFAPMWVAVPKPSADPHAETTVPASAAYAMIWRPECQEEIGLSVEQKKALLEINAKRVAEAKAHAEQFKQLSSEEQQAKVKTWAGKPSPWSQQFDNDIRKEIEAVLTPRQLQAFKDYCFPMYAIGLVYDAEVRQEIGFGQEQADRFRGVAKERFRRFQQESLGRNEKIWSLLSPQQQKELPGVVKRQGPTSAVLSLAGELGFSLDATVPGYPMLTEAPVRERLKLNAEQEKQLGTIMADAAQKSEMARTKRLEEWERRAAGEQLQSKAGPNQESDLLEEGKKQVEAILTPQQLTTLKEIDLHRAVVLALGYPEKRKAASITEQQAADLERIAKETNEQLYRIDREMVAQALKVLSAQQQQKLREKIDQRGW